MHFQGNNFTKMHMAQKKCSSSYHGRCFIVMMLGGFLTMTGTLVMVSPKGGGEAAVEGCPCCLIFVVVVIDGPTLCHIP